MQNKSLSIEGLLLGWSPQDRSYSLGYKNGIGFMAKVSKKPNHSSHTVVHQGDGHLMTIAPTGSGKGVGCIIPTLLTYPGPVVVIDPKGENYAITSRRRREMGQKVVVLDPFGVTGDKSDTLNPFDIINPHRSSCIDDALMLADTLVADRSDRDPFWDNMALELITGGILHVASYKAKERPFSPGKLREFLASSVHNMAIEFDSAVSDPATKNYKHARQRVGEMAEIILNAEERVRSSIISTAHSHTAFLSTPAVKNALSRSSFSLGDVLSAKPLSIYIVIPPEKLSSHSRLLRLWISVLLTVISRRKQKPARSTLFILDEAAQLGELPMLRQAITLLRGYGLQTWTFWQDLSQLKSNYPKDWETMFNNSHVHQTFGITNMHMAKQLAELYGHPRHDELLRLNAKDMLLMQKGERPIIIQRLNYLHDKMFNSLFDENPYFSSDEHQKLIGR